MLQIFKKEKIFLDSKLLIPYFTIAYYGNIWQNEEMEDLLTAKQVQELLQVDRTTVYRMLKDGRLSGVKIGKNWRFLRKNIDALLQEKSNQKKTTLIKARIFPSKCIQGLQDIFSEVAGVSCVAVDSEAHFLTQISNPTAFCKHIQSSEKGLRACQQSWKKAIQQKQKSEPFFTCHAGLNYTIACIRMGNLIKSFILCGQFVENNAQKQKIEQAVTRLAKSLNLNADVLKREVQKISVLNPRVRTNLKLWLERLAQSLIDLTQERNQLVERLQKINELSAPETETTVST